MALDSKHPHYSLFVEDWTKLRDSYGGERSVKAKGAEYLPPTSGMEADGLSPGQPGHKAYQAYLKRAVFHDFVSDAVEAMIGMMHHKPPVIELPAAMEGLREKATPGGETLEHLLRRINEQQLVTGRLGLLLDMPTTPDPKEPLPYIALYTAEAITNWDEGAKGEVDLPVLNLVVLNESEYERENDFEWKFVNKYRVLVLGELSVNEKAAAYRQGLFSSTNGALTYSEAGLMEPSIRGKRLEQVPFVFVNTKDIVPTPDNPPLLGLANLAMAIYRGEADYRQNLFMQGQDTLVVIGGSDEEEIRTGAGAAIRVRQGGDAKYIGVSSQGLSEQRQSLENDKLAAGNKAGQIDTRSKQRESGDALQVRVAAQTATLNQIALTGAAALQALLRIAATWMGINPDEVKVTPNLEFATNPFTSKELVELMTAKTLGAPLSRETIHETMVDRGMTKKDYEEELRLIEEEEPLGGLGTDAGGDPDDPPGGGQPNDEADEEDGDGAGRAPGGTS